MVVSRPHTSARGLVTTRIDGKGETIIMVPRLLVKVAVSHNLFVFCHCVRQDAQQVLRYMCVLGLIILM